MTGSPRYGGSGCDEEEYERDRKEERGYTGYVQRAEERAREGERAMTQPSFFVVSASWSVSRSGCIVQRTTGRKRTRAKRRRR